MADDIQFWVVGEWTMVYLNGELQRAGDSYLADEWLQQRCGVVTVYDATGDCMADDRTAHPALSTAIANRDARQERTKRADELRRQAEQLMNEAKELES